MSSSPAPSTLNRNSSTSSSSNGQNQLPKKPNLTTSNSQNNLLNSSISSPNPIHSKRTTPTLGLFPNSISQSPSSPNSLGFGKSSFQNFGRVGDHSQPPSPGIFNNSSIKKPFHHQLSHQQSTGNQTFQNNNNNQTNRPRKLGSFNSLAAHHPTPPTPPSAPASTTTINSGLTTRGISNKDERDLEENELEERSELVSDPIHPTLDSSLGHHKLRSKWVFWLLHRPPSKKISEEEYGKAMRRLGSCDTVESFYSLYLHIKRPSNHQPISDLHIFVDPIKPAWEDPLNVRGGKWTIRLKKGLANRLWETLILSLVGGGLEKLIANPNPDLDHLNTSSSDENTNNNNNNELSDYAREICGAVLSIRRDEDILAVWHKTGAPEVGGDGKMAKQVKLALQTVLQLPLNCNLVYKLNADCLSSTNGGVSMTTIGQNIQLNPYHNNSNNNNNNHNQHHNHNHHHHHQGQGQSNKTHYNPNHHHLKQQAHRASNFNNNNNNNTHHHHSADLAKTSSPSAAAISPHPFAVGLSSSVAPAGAVDLTHPDPHSNINHRHKD
ncbi:hypothetical protein PGT21_021619 [Puccinia graminis f. sp. tritici]|uniref:Eukaryotic translation initiation factor 4E type 2 n=1 Tax=Puccinia graminis f. sp. tritici TaxID=56615 RepID=A0A5B0RGP2_PUCGR|nr:hypothetical protein PGT21_021619 [Puccinia graminis f. sp. tritici]KAA1124103.1 hypothetical protein PGTUg99_027477 [Puccinia graminis f. sp. tritici]